jgi:CubicO group peptidase (beta-lactamase class C family)
VSVDDARRVIEDAIEARIFPAASMDVGMADGLIWFQPFGRLTFDADSPATIHDTIYDLASLTKPIACTTIVMELIERRALSLDTRVAEFFDEWRGADREGVTVRDLLEHASGLPARLLDVPPQTRREFEHDICVIPFEYACRSRSVYSDLGFILLGFLAERIGAASLAVQFEQVIRIQSVRLEPGDVPGAFHQRSDSPFEFAIDDVLAFGVPAEARRWAAPTEPMIVDPRRGRRLAGEVHDNYAAVLGGAAGHAGLFANASGVGAFARMLLRSARGDNNLPAPFAPDVTRLMTTKSTVPDSSRALGWDTMLPTSSCGTRMSGAAFGHVGYTGTSLWIDPTRDRYFVLLTNRAFGGGTLEEMRAVRRAFHDALADL